MAFIKLPINPGVYKDDTALAAEGFFVDSDKIRFVRGRPQTIGGWERVTSSVFQGICRGLWTWRDNTGLGYAAIGTHSYLYAMQDAQLYDVTPIISRGQYINPFSTSSGSSTITADVSTHGLSDNQRIGFPGISSLGGASLTNTQGYPVTVITVNRFTFAADSVATGSNSSIGGSLSYETYLAPGLIDGTGGAGYGTGAWDVGTYGISTNTIYYPRTWSLSNWGQNLLASPRGGAIYEFAPLFTQTELVTNGDMSSATGWTQGTGWLIAAGAATASVGSASDLETTITMNPSAYFTLDADITRSAGTLSVMIGTATLTSTITSTQHYKTTLFTGVGALKFSKSAAFAGTVKNVSVKQIIHGTILPNAPITNTCMLVTPERIVMAFGTIDSTTGLFNPMHIRWSDQDTVVTTGLPGSQTWTANATNQASFFTLSQGGRIVGARNGRGEILAWTDSALYVGRYGGDFVYSWTLVGVGCGLIGPNAATIMSGVAYWMAPSGEFWAYAGGQPSPLQSTIRRDVFDNLSPVQQDKIYAFACASYSEVWWLYPDFRDGNECSRYALYSTLGGQVNIWAPGTFDRTAWIDAGPSEYPIATDTLGNIYFQEKGDSADGGLISWSLKTAAFDLGQGDNLFQIDGLIPDSKGQQGIMNLTFGVYLYPGSAVISDGPYMIDASTEKVDLMLTGRQADLLFEGTAAPLSERFGAPRLNVKDTGMSW